RVWDAASGAPAGAPLPHGGGVARASFHPDGERVLTASADGSACVWRLAAGTPVALRQLKHARPVTDASFSPDGRQVATASEDHTARLWDAATGEPASQPPPHHAT